MSSTPQIFCQFRKTKDVSKNTDCTLFLLFPTIEVRVKDKVKLVINTTESVLDRNGELVNVNVSENTQEHAFQINTEKEKVVFSFQDAEEFVTALIQIGLKMDFVGTYGYPLRLAILKSGWRYPIPIFRTIQYLKYNKAHLEVGIFRLSSEKEKIEKFHQILNDDKDSAKIDFEDVYVASNVLKDYFRSLDEPVIPFKFYNQFKKCGEIVNEKEKCVNEIKKVIFQLPIINQNCLWYLMEYLNIVVLNSKVNKMTPNNLARIFVQNILKPSKIDQLQYVSDLNYLTDAVEAMIVNFKNVFKDIKEEIDRK
ncbi:hypothetical protein EIN_340710 [Entamoeba invadens IP1]|uniref:Rho-GAP domain-containing protein n=1 Tax=Entamoeba invadens IP1 TaxID=370355 RepID=A0A0A1UGB4_ENTIV|nr:hypothetical protein EIN_340710 [Entamoeba invadens IP1]ELP94733.1 hypothetical protein EIN_340710 [Entamoeba invadens IP1]|eukprot:XP_004261504.1 hypothetical protein EIN_340710 [Entamoeba invadens IP1]